MAKQMTQEEFEKRLKEVQPNMMVLGEYKNCSTKIKVKCTVCGYVRDALPSNLTHKSPRKCPNCSGGLPITHEEYCKKLDEFTGGKISPIEKYTYKNVKMRHKCNVCGYEWATTPAHLLFKDKPTGCPHCNGG